MENNKISPISGTLSSSASNISGTIVSDAGKISGSLSLSGKPGMSAYELAVKYGFQGTEEEWVNSLGFQARVGTCEYWAGMADFIPAVGEILYYEDYDTQENEFGISVFVPAMKLGNGINTVAELPFLSMTGETQKLKFTITIGDQTFDGTEDIKIPIYTGEE